MVNYVKLFRLLLTKKLSPIIIRLMMNMYTNQTIRVRWGSCITALHTISNGVKQGGVLSPILFILYVDELLIRLRKCSIGCHIGHTFCGALGYADDIVIMPTYSALDSMLDVCKQFALEYDLLFNSAKTKLMVFERRSNVPDVSFMGENIQHVTSEKHLGNIVGYN